MSQDLIDVMKELGHEQFYVAGHDRGARAAHRMALDHPKKIIKLAVIDILPSHYIWNNTSASWADTSWHWLFMMQPYDMPERMMAGVSAEYYIEKKISKPGKGLRPFSKEALAEYVRCFNWKTIRGSCEDYRACATSDLTMDTNDFVSNKKILCPTLTIWGKDSHTGKVYGDLLPIWEKYVSGKLTGGEIDCGHYVIEEKPKDTAGWLLQHFNEH
jgi:haloacetate dehalogenase